MAEPISREPGAYLLSIELAAPLALDIPRLGAATLPPGCYAYGGSAYGPGGLRARIGRHLRRDKPPCWHIDRLTGAGRVVGVRAVPGGRECVLVQALLELPGASVPIPGFGSSDCRSCPAHLVMVPAGSEPAIFEDLTCRAACGQTPGQGTEGAMTGRVACSPMFAAWR